MNMTIDDVHPKAMPEGWVFVERHKLGSHEAAFYRHLSSGLNVSMSVENPVNKPPFTHFAFSFPDHAPTTQEIAEALAALFVEYTEGRELRQFPQQTGLHPYTIHVQCVLTPTPRTLN